MKNKKIFQTAVVIFTWAVLAFVMSIFYYWLKSVGLIWDNPGNFAGNETWNSRKVIFGIVGLSSFILAIVKISIIWGDDK
jgi:hypothetical protein